MLAVVDLNTHSLPVAISHQTIVDMGKMLVFDANLVSKISSRLVVLQGEFAANLNFSNLHIIIAM